MHPENNRCLAHVYLASMAPPIAFTRKMRHLIDAASRIITACRLLGSLGHLARPQFIFRVRVRCSRVHQVTSALSRRVALI